MKEYIREKVDGQYKDTYVDQLQETEGRMDYLKPFNKKKEPFTEMESKKVAEYENILQNMSVEEDLLMDEKNNFSQLVVDKEKLEHRFNRSLIKI